MAGADRQRPELVERETPVEEPGGDLFDAVQFGLVVGVGGFLPGPGALEGDVMGGQDLPQPFPLDLDLPCRYLPGVVVAVDALSRVRDNASYAEVVVMPRWPWSPGLGAVTTAISSA